jgi:hypothetical protein
MPLLLTAKWLALAEGSVNAAYVLLAAGDHAGPTNVTGMRPPRFPDRFPDRFFELDLRECECMRRLVPR